MSSLSGKIYPYPPTTTSIDHFDRLPDSLLLIVFNQIGDVKSLGRCCVVSRRFSSLIPQIDDVTVRVDCVIPDDHAATPPTPTDKPRGGVFGSIVKAVCGGIVKPFQAIAQILASKKTATPAAPEDVTHHSPTQVLKNFNEIRRLRIELPSGELGIEDGVLLKWRADFGSTLDNCVILGASSVVYPGPITKSSTTESADGFGVVGNGDDGGSIPDSFYTSGGLKLRVVWTISSLIAAAARHYLLHPIISEHRTLDNLILTDSDGQGVLCMNKEQLEELRVKPLAPSTASKRTLVPALNMRLWYSPQLQLSDGAVLKGATLIAIRPSEQSLVKKEVSDGAWMSNVFGEPYNTAVKQLIKRRTYCLEMNSF